MSWLVVRGENAQRDTGRNNMSSKHWLASYGQKIPCEIDPNAHGSVLDLLEGAMRSYAGKPAFRCFGQTLTYADADRLSRDFAAYLQGKLGVKKGDRVAVMLPNIPAMPLPSTDIKLLDDDNNEAPLGEPGEVCAKGPQVMGGYWQKPDANVEAFTADGYFCTGVIGVFDDKGFL